MAGVFLVIYRFAPQRLIGRGDVWPAALVTAVLREATLRRGPGCADNPGGRPMMCACIGYSEWGTGATQGALGGVGPAVPRRGSRLVAPWPGRPGHLTR